jgi:aminoglycoside phosphotransferase (APT) family kinase protein
MHKPHQPKPASHSPTTHYNPSTNKTAGAQVVSHFDDFIGTKPVADRQKFNLQALGAYMQAHVEGFTAADAAALQAEQFKGGQSNPTFRLTANGRRFVMRAKPGPKAKLLPSAHAVEREFKVQRALHGVGFPVAKQYALCEDESVIGRAFYIMDCVEGRVLWDQGLPGHGNADRAAIYGEMNRVMSSLHTTDFAAIGLADYGKPGNYFARQIERWTKQYKLAETEKIEEMDNLIAWLPQHIPAGDETTIVHGDYRLDNMIFHPTEARVLAVLDWELSTLGHPLADFSYHCMSWHIAPGAFRGIAGLDLAALGIPSEQQYIDQYGQRTGKNVDTRDWGFYMAYNMFRLCGILQGIMKRYVDGTASSQQALESGSRAKPMAQMGWDQVEKMLKA